ncbi:DEAD/DEAH box helicase domain protein [Alkalidesulfovibrio alkalitolerans DSM 16529]|uniref:DEAD/DEAH box helicase domain protein n=1 Tax=Alkalidesulfovibrio alkalitolerans DSM 16529 TaxID=1121439 RepID=S7TCM0_9BACT|nr:DEAD/DEAH box helicase domain protein [Alkalidesulfovibrio alkalitolerans DSM 16529]
MSGVRDFVAAVMDSPVLGPDVVHHRLLPASEPSLAETARPLPQALRLLLSARGVASLYSHQAEAVDLARMGRHVVVATPTASGKSLTYTLPMFEEFLARPDSRALCLFPLKALAQDQLRTFGELAALLPSHERLRAASYDGDTPDHVRRKLRQDPPHVLLTNPEMLHLSLLPHHATWAALWASLSFVVVDEAHTYRGVMGSHMALVFRRLRRMCDYYGSSPTFVFCSATVGNPVELSEGLSGLCVSPVLASGAPTGSRHVLFVNPEASPATAAIRLLKECLERGLRTIVYAKSRRMTELIALWAAEKSGEFKGRISAYRAGFLPEERREIEGRMASGELLAVISTSALELGIDIGGLDVCILAGYPGTVMQTLQRGGRVGRKQQDSAVVLVAGEDNLDQYFMRHPEDFFARPPEAAVLNPYNPVIVARHLDCAAAELTLARGEPFLAEEPIAMEAERMAAAGELLVSADGRELHSKRKRPHREVDLRGAGASMPIIDLGPAGPGDDGQATPEEGAAKGRVIGQIDAHRAMREAHEGAVYLHRGRSYVVAKLDLRGKSVFARPARVGYYTRTRAEKDTEILAIHDQATALGCRVFLGRLRVTERITGYEKRRAGDNGLLTLVPLDMPPLVFETEGLWFEIPRAVQQATEDTRHHFMGGIHAMEHAAIGILPLLVMADRNDIGGISTPFHPQVGRAAVFIYDGHPGGVGLTRQAFSQAAELLRTTLTTVRDCACELGCPSCVHSPKCGSGNRPISKDAACFVLEALATATPETFQPLAPTEENMPPPSSNCEPREPRETATRPLPAYGVLDVETRRSAQEVGGWHRAARMGVAVAVLYDSRDQTFHAYTEERIPELAERLAGLGLVIGFNIKRFDYLVLSGAHDFDFAALPTLDMLDTVKARLGYRLSLGHLAEETLGVPKSADGLQSLQWWKEGRLDLITEYCTRDVQITRDLYLHGRERGHLLFRNKHGQVVQVPVDW